MTGWVCQWNPFEIPVDDSFKKAYVEEWVFQVHAASELSLSESQGDVIPETPKVSLPVSSSPWRPPKNEDTACSRERIEATHCLHCNHNLHVNVWNYPCPVMLSSPATRILSHQDLINLPFGER